MTAHLSSSNSLSIQPTTDAGVIREIALATWYPTYGNILSGEQIEYMLTEVYSLESLRNQMAEGQTFLLLSDGGTPVAFAAYSLLNASEHRFKLNKLYIHPAHQGRGAGKQLLQEVILRTKALGGQKLELNVHRRNPAQHFYFKSGFKIAKIVDLPFARFTLNDYILELNLAETS